MMHRNSVLISCVSISIRILFDKDLIVYKYKIYNKASVLFELNKSAVMDLVK